MIQSSDNLRTPEHKIAALRRWDAVSIALGLLTIALVLVAPAASQPEPSYWNVLLGTLFYIGLYAVLSLLAYPLSYGLEAGFHHVAVVAAFLTFGPACAVVTAFNGKLLAECGQLLLSRRLELRRLNLYEIVRNILFQGSAHASSVLLAGLLYLALGGLLPLTSAGLSLWLPFITMFVVTTLLHELLILAHLFWSGTVVSLRKIGDALPGLIFAEVFSLPVALLLPITYYQLPLTFFILLAAGVVMVAALFRISERSRWALRRRLVELSTLDRIGQSLTASLEMTDLVHTIYDQVARLADIDTFVIALYEASTSTVTFPFVMRGGVQMTLEERQNGNGLAEYVIRQGKPVILSGSLKKEAARLGITYVPWDAACWVGVPMVTSDGIIGEIGIENLTNPNAFGSAEVSLLTIIAAQAAVGLRNANLYQRVWGMAEELTLLNNVSSVVTATLDLDIVLETTCTVVTQLGHSDRIAVFLNSEDGGTLRLAHSIGLSDDFVAQFQGILGEALTQSLNSTEPLAIPNVMTDPRALGWRSLAEVEGYRALLTVPLVANERVIGFLATFYSQPHSFDKNEMTLIATLANQVSVTVANARLYQDTQARAAAMTRLVEASRAFTASLDLPSVAEKVLDELADVLSPDAEALLLIRHNSRLLRPIAQRGHEPLTIHTITPAGSILQAISNARPIILPAVPDDIALLKQFQMQSLYALPLVAQDTVIGIVVIGHQTFHTYTDRERQLAEALVNQASVAIRNAQLYSQTDAQLADRVLELSSIEAISRQISGELDLATIINDVLDAALSVTQADAAGCGLIASKTTLNFAERYPKSSGLAQVNMPFSTDTGIIGRVLRTGQLSRVDDIRTDPDFVEGPLKDTLSELCVPIVHKGERVGVVDLTSRELNHFTGVHERFLLNLADHAAIAIGNARLFDDRQNQIETLIKFRNLSLELLSAGSLKEVMGLVVEYAMILLPAKDTHLYLYDRHSDALSFGASLWLDGRENVEASPPHPTGRTWQVAHTGQAHLIEDTAQLAPQPDFRNGPGFGAMARIPLKRYGFTIGVLNIAFRAAHHFTENEIRALDLLANQAAIAIDNVRLMDEIRVGHDRMQAILDLTSDGVLLLGQNGELILANSPAEQMLDYPLQSHLGRDGLRLVARVLRERNRPELYKLMVRELDHLLDDVKLGERTVQRTLSLDVKGLTRHIESTLLPVGDTGSVLGGRLIILRDVSEEKSLEHFREELTNMIVHDLRSPLSGVISSLRLIEDMVAQNDMTDFKEVLNIALASSENQMRQIESMLEIDKLEKGQMPLHIHALPLEPLVKEAISALDMLAEAEKIRMVISIPPALPPVRMDSDLIRRVLVNLLDNALRHTPAHGEIRVEVSLMNDGGYAKIGVIDTGRGIPAEMRERIFAIYVQIPKSALRGRRGMGLGLTFCKLSVEAHGGKIWVDSGPEGGAAFWFTLPLAEEKVASSE